MDMDKEEAANMTKFQPGGRTLDEIITDLSKPIPDEYLKEKVKGGAKLTIFEWMTAQRFLDMLAPGWSGQAKLTYSNERVGCVYQICIPTSDAGIVCRSATGDDQEDDDDETEQERRQRLYGSPTTRAEGQAFKRAAARFGFGLYLRDKRGKAAPPQPTRQAAPTKQVAVAPREGLRASVLKHQERLQLSNREIRGVIETLSGIAQPDSATMPLDKLGAVVLALGKMKDKQAVADAVDSLRDKPERVGAPTVEELNADIADYVAAGAKQ